MFLRTYEFDVSILKQEILKQKIKRLFMMQLRNKYISNFDMLNTGQ